VFVFVSHSVDQLAIFYSVCVFMPALWTLSISTYITLVVFQSAFRANAVIAFIKALPAGADSI
jgi:hypothetical protein